MTEDLLAADDNTSVDPNKNYLEELVGDGKKFKSVEELARGKAEADLTIELFKKRQDELRNDYLKLREEHMAGAQLKDEIDRLRAAASTSDNTTANDTKPIIDTKEIESLVSNKIQEYELTKKQESNFSQVVSRLEEQFGSNYKTALKQQADALGLSPEDVNALARKSPNAFYKTFGIGEHKPDLFNSPTRSTQRTDTFAPTNQKRSWSYYQNLKQKDPAAYNSAKTHNQMIEDYRTLGEAFKDGDFSKFGNL